MRVLTKLYQYTQAIWNYQCDMNQFLNEVNYSFFILSKELLVIKILITPESHPYIYSYSSETEIHHMHTSNIKARVERGSIYDITLWSCSQCPVA